MPGLRIILVRPKGPGNIGAAARAMKNFGLSELYLVAPRRPLTHTAYAFASHARDILDHAVILDDLVTAIKDCKVVLGTTARPRASESFQIFSARTAAETFPAEGVAVIFGPEDFGLSNDDLDHCQGYIQIPTAAYASLNLAQAVQIVAYEWFIARLAQKEAKQVQNMASREELEAMYAQLLDTLYLIGYTDEQREANARRFVRSVFDRAELTSKEVAALRGLWRQVSWAAERSRKRLGQRHPKR